MTQGPGQHVIVYGSAKGKAVVFDTAYTEGQIEETIKRCVQAHGSKANVRSMLAKDRTCSA